MKRTTPAPYIISIPHTGTRFTKALLGLAWPESDDVCPHSHIYAARSRDMLMQRISQYHGNIIVPLRHPHAIMASWAKRDRPVNELYEAVKLLAEFSDEFEYLCVDLPGIRDQQLQAIAERYGIPFETSWEPVTELPRTPAITNPKSILPPFRVDPFTRFYE